MQTDIFINLYLHINVSFDTFSSLANLIHPVSHFLVKIIMTTDLARIGTLALKTLISDAIQGGWALMVCNLLSHIPIFFIFQRLVDLVQMIRNSYMGSALGLRVGQV